MYLYYSAVVQRTLLVSWLVLAAFIVAYLVYIEAIFDDGSRAISDAQELQYIAQLFLLAGITLVPLIFWRNMFDARDFMAALFDAIKERLTSPDMQCIYQSKAARLEVYACEQLPGTYYVQVVHGQRWFEYIVQRECIERATKRGGIVRLDNVLRILGLLLAKKTVDV